MKYILKKIILIAAVIEIAWLVFSYAQVLAHQSDTFNGKPNYQLPSWNAFSVMETLGNMANGGR